MSGVSKFNVWSEHLEEADVAPVETLRPETALLLVLAAAHDEDCLVEGAAFDEIGAVNEDWFVRDLGTGLIRRYRSTVYDPSRRVGLSLELCQLRACRVCGCIDEQACPGGCHWVGPDLCSACVPRKVA